MPMINLNTESSDIGKSPTGIYASLSLNDYVQKDKFEKSIEDTKNTLDEGLKSLAESTEEQFSDLDEKLDNLDAVVFDNKKDTDTKIYGIINDFTSLKEYTKSSIQSIENSTADKIRMLSSILIAQSVIIAGMIIALIKALT